MVCRWPQSQEGDWARPHLWDCKLAWYGPWPVWKRFIRHRVWWGRSKPGCWIVGSVTIVWLTTVTCLYRWLCFWCRRQLSLCASVRTSDSLKTFRDVMISTDSAIVVCVSVSCLTSHTVYMQQGRGLWCVTVCKSLSVWLCIYVSGLWCVSMCRLWCVTVCQSVGVMVHVSVCMYLPSVLWRCWLGGKKGIQSVKNRVVGCWRGYLSGARCRLAYGPADATATHCLLLQ